MVAEVLVVTAAVVAPAPVLEDPQAIKVIARTADPAATEILLSFISLILLRFSVGRAGWPRPEVLFRTNTWYSTRIWTRMGRQVIFFTAVAGMFIARCGYLN